MTENDCILTDIVGKSIYVAVFIVNNFLMEEPMKKFLLLLIFCLTFTMPSFAKPAENWIILPNNSEWAIETNSIRYDSTNNTADAWIKKNLDDGIRTVLLKVRIYFNTKTYSQITWIRMVNGEIEKVEDRTKSYFDKNKMTRPFGQEDDIANIISKKYGLPPVYSFNTKETRLKKFYTSSSGRDYFLDRDSIKFDFINNIVYIWCAGTPKYDDSMFFSIYKCDLQRKSVLWILANLDPDFVLSIHTNRSNLNEEPIYKAIFNYAESEYKKRCTQ